MKILIQKAIILIAFSTPLLIYAQTNKAYEMNINDVKVIVQPSGNEIVVVQTIIKGGVQNYSADKAGIESLAMTGLTECGTMKDDKNSFKNKLDKISAQVNGDTRMDFATFSLNCIKGDFETAWLLYTDAMISPRFDAKEFSRINRTRSISSGRANQTPTMQ